MVSFNIKFIDQKSMEFGWIESIFVHYDLSIFSHSVPEFSRSFKDDSMSSTRRKAQ